MSVKDRLTAGDFVTLVPLGLPVTLQYDDRGMLETAYRGYINDRTDELSPEIVSQLRGDSVVPLRVYIKGGTTWLFGVVTCADFIARSGDLAEESVSYILEQIKKTPESLVFYAGDIHSLSVVFGTVTAKRNWLKMAGLAVLPGGVVPYNRDLNMLISSMDKSGPAVVQPHDVTYLLIHHMSDTDMVNLHKSQYYVTKVATDLDEAGYVKGVVEFAGETKSPMIVDYPDVKANNIYSKSWIRFDADDNIEWVTRKSPVRSAYPSKFTCPICGASYLVPNEGPMQCSDVHCKSRLYPATVDLLAGLELPQVTYDRYREFVDSYVGDYTPADILDAEEYADVTVEVKLFQILRAVIPGSQNVSNELLFEVCKLCNNAPATLEYYVTHPDRLLAEPQVSPTTAFRRLYVWLLDRYNQHDVVSLLHNAKIHVVNDSILFEGAPIFRDKHIVVTGKFIHGDIDTISAIFSSYGAHVSSTLSDNTGCVVVGDLNEDTNGALIRTANYQHVPIYSESEFFNMYGIDDDMRSNL